MRALVRAAALSSAAAMLLSCGLFVTPPPAPAAQASSAAATSAGPRTVRVYSSLPLTGALRAQSQGIVNGIKMAFDESGGQNGTGARLGGTLVVEHESLDAATVARQGWDPVQEAANARRATEDDRTVGYLGTYNSSAARISMPLLDRAGIPMISPAASASDLTLDRSKDALYRPSGARGFFRVVPNDSAQGGVAARWMKELRIGRVFVVDDAGDYGKAVAGAFDAAAKVQGLAIAGRESAAVPQAYSAIAAKVAASGADALYYTGVVDEMPGVLFRAVRGASPRIVLMGPDGIFDDELVRQAATAAEGVYATAAGIPVDRYTGRAAEWASRYRAKYAQEPQLYSVYGYESALIMLAAVRASGGDRTKMIDAVRRAGTAYEGLLGTWSFDANGDTTDTTHTGAVVQGGKWIFAKRLS